MYELVYPPFAIKLQEMNKKQFKEYYQWLMDSISVRVHELEKVVIQTDGFEDWKADFSPESLNQLGEWFVLNVGVRKKTSEELEQIKSQLTFPIDIPEEDLTYTTRSFAFDIGIYLSQVFLHNNPTLKWEQYFGSKKHIDYGQPVLKGFGKVNFNPIQITITLAHGIARKNKDGRGLKAIYDIWSSQIDKI